MAQTAKVKRRSMKNKVFIIGDDAKQTESLQLLLQNAGYDVHPIANQDENLSNGELLNEAQKENAVVIDSRENSERKQSEKALKESEERFRAQYKNIPMPTYTWQKQGDDFIFIDCNDAAQNLAKGKVHKLIGAPASVIYNHEPSIIENLHRCFDEHRAINQALFYHYRSTTDETRYLEINYVFVPPDLVMAHTRDLTDNVKAAKSLQASENRFQLAARATSDALWDWNMQAGTLWLNDGFFEMFGYDREEPAPEPEFLKRNVHDEDREPLLKKFQDFIESRQSDWAAEYRYRRQDGTYADIYERAYALRDEKGNPTRMIGAMMDVSERKRAENAVRFQALLLDTVEQAVVATDFNGFITYWNKFAEKIFGWTATEVLNKEALKFLVPEESAAEAEIAVKQLKEGKSWNGEMILKRRDGTVFPAQQINSPVNNEKGERVGMLGIITDISENSRTKKENILLSSQIEVQRQRLNTIIANIPGVVWESRLEMSSSAQFSNFVSDYVEKMIGYSVEEWLSEPNFWLRIMHPEDRAHAELEVKTFIEDKETAVQQYRWVAKDGTIVWVETQMVLITDESGKPFSLRGISIDVTERKLIEEALQKSEEQLRQSQKLESVGRLAGGIAHDFNNMLTAINGYSDLILREIGDDDSLRKKVLEIKKAGERSSALTHQLLAFSRRQVLQPKLIDLNRVVTDMSQLLLRLIGEDIQLNIELDEKPSCVEADPGQLSQVIMNLVVNARDAMLQGGELTVKTEKVLFENEAVAQFATKRKGWFVMLSVIDNGTGIEGKILEQIFEPFFTTKQVGVGTGLGLSTVYGIVKQSGGYIWVNSEIGKGSEFKVYLPFVEGEKQDKKEKKRLEQFPYGSETILLVEDEEMVRDLTRRILELCGYTVVEARNGVEALKICEEISETISLLMTDVVMPQMNGRELSEKVSEINPSIKTLFTSGYMNDRVMRHGVSDDEVNFIQKPFAPDVLARKIRQLLDDKD